MQLEKEIWLDAQLSPAIAFFIKTTFSIKCVPLRDLGLRDASDVEIFNKAKGHGSFVILITKDIDFTEILIRNDSPPKIILLTCGNTSNEILQRILFAKLTEALQLLDNPENDIVEITD